MYRIKNNFKLKTTILNGEDKSYLRRYIEGELRNDNITSRVRLHKDLLEDLLFITIVNDEERVRIPVWSGEFLSKLDLSQVDFSDVSWTLAYDIHNKSITKENKRLCDYIMKQFDINTLPTGIYYGNTNANIDFKTSYEYKKSGKFIIKECVFNGTDLSNNDLDGTFYIVHGYFSDTGLKISCFNSKCYADSCNFTGVDLSQYSVTGKNIVDGKYIFKNNCTVRMSGMKITNISNKMTGLEEILEMYHDGEFDGCYINGVLVKSEYDLSKNRERLSKEHKNEIYELRSKIKKRMKEE